MEREIKQLKRSQIPLVKVCWNSRQGPEFTWECEDSFKKKYPHLFTNRASSSTTRLEHHSQDDGREDDVMVDFPVMIHKNDGWRIYVRGVPLLLAFVCSRFGALVMSAIEMCELNTEYDWERNLLPFILAQVGNQGNVGNQNGNVVNENVQENVRNVLVNGNRVGCSYKEFLACNPKEYDGKGGVVVLTRWIEKMESVQDMSGCSIDQKVKYTAGSLVGKALTWWNSQIRTLSREVAVSMSWNDFKLMMIEEFCPSHEMQKLETELWNHAMVGAGHAAYTDRFHELARLVPHLVTPESRKIERYVYGLAPQICGMVAATEPKTMQKAVQISGALTDEAVRNGSIKKVEKRGNVGEPSKDKNGRDDNKRTRTSDTNP
ncbi:reverse transcriptase domain-containing protein [Tanacetum coccineum]|uniref:Reverse transcriptase domain-containing protein n=1 Tax=Tanacetum coccineum TaxID=301880 RepID=A0ABQ5G057_9ASTR